MSSSSPSSVNNIQSHCSATSLSASFFLRSFFLFFNWQGTIEELSKPKRPYRIREAQENQGGEHFLLEMNRQSAERYTHTHRCIHGAHRKTKVSVRVCVHTLLCLRDSDPSVDDNNISHHKKTPAGHSRLTQWRHRFANELGLFILLFFFLSFQYLDYVESGMLHWCTLVFSVGKMALHLHIGKFMDDDDEKFLFFLVVYFSYSVVAVVVVVVVVAAAACLNLQHANLFLLTH